MARDPATAPSGTSMITPRRRTNHGDASGARPTSAPTVKISDADPLVYLQTFVAFITCCQSILAFLSSVIISRKDQENMIARSNRAFQTGIGPDPYPSPAPPRAAEGVSGWRS